MGHHYVVVVYNVLGLGVIGNVTIVINPTREEPRTCLLGRPPRYEHILQLDIIRQHYLNHIDIALYNRRTPSLKQPLCLFITTISSFVSLLTVNIITTTTTTIIQS